MFLWRKREREFRRFVDESILYVDELVEQMKLMKAEADALGGSECCDLYMQQGFECQRLSRMMAASVNW